MSSGVSVVAAGAIRTNLISTGTLRVLVVDDDERYCQLVERKLCRSEGESITVDMAGTTTEALACCTEHSYDCLIVDFCLPDGTGTALLERLADISGCNIPPAIITTADGGENAATEAIRVGAVDFLAKRDVNNRSLLRSIHNAVEKHRLAESLRSRNADLLKANKRLQRNRQEIMRFYHTVSHEVKTPLAATREFISLVRDGAEGTVSDGQDYLLQLAMDGCDQIHHQFTDLLDITRLESGKLVLKRSAVTVEYLVARSFASVSTLARSRNVSLVKHGVSGLSVFADPDRLVQVLSNLLHNAVKFSTQGSEVVLFTQHGENDMYVTFKVEDSGCGIDDHEQDAVFDRLFQSDQQRMTSSACGLGLGLAIARDIVNLHGGHLAVESTLGIGTTFYFQIPLDADTT